MARIAAVPARKAGLYGRLACYFTRRSLAQLTGRSPEGVIQPLRCMRTCPGCLRGYVRPDLPSWYIGPWKCVR